MKRVIEFEPGFDKRNPDPTKNYGIHGMQIRFVVKGELGATQFLLYTDWFPEQVQKEHFDSGYGFPFFQLQPMGADVGYHSPTPFYSDQYKTEECPYLDGKTCYYDGSGLRAEELTKKFLEFGDDVVWDELEQYYIDRFGELK